MRLAEARLMGLRDTVDLLLRHPLNRDRKLRAIARWLRWQAGSLLVPGQVAVPFVNDALLLAGFGMAAATGNVYAGLYEFEDMAFIGHVLRPGDLFVDVGANVGTYTLIAAAVGARTVSIEPIGPTFRQLERNIDLNRLRDQVEPHNLGVGAEPGRLRFIDDHGPMNRVASGAEAGIEVEVTTLDALLTDRTPLALKIDVEGFETNVVRGADRTLRRSGLLAVLLERNGNGARYGFDEEALHQKMLSFGFSVFRYDPLQRSLGAPDARSFYAGNTLYVRDANAVQQRLATAPPLRVAGRSL